MRILHVVHQYVPDHTAGTELHTRIVARKQAERGHETAVFTPVNRREEFTVEPAVEDGVHVYRAPAGARSPSAVFRSTFRHPDLAAAFAAVLAREQPDIVHVQHLMGIPAVIGAQLIQSGIPYVISLHDYWFGCANGQLLTNDTETICAGPDEHFHNCGRCAVARAGFTDAAGLLGRPIAPIMRRRNALLRPIFDHAARIMAPNGFVRHIFAEMGFPVTNMILTPLGLDTPPDLAARIAERRAGRAAGGLRLGYLGSIGRQKGVHVLISAMNELPWEGVTLDLYGDPAVFPDYAAGLQAQAQHPGIRFRGLVPRERLWDALADLDVLVMPTLWYEASPYTIREAFAARLPVIASDIGAPGSMVRHGVDGLLFAPGDAAALRNTLLDLLRRPERVAELRAGIAPVRTVEAHLEEVEQVYAEVLAAE